MDKSVSPPRTISKDVAAFFGVEAVSRVANRPRLKAAENAGISRDLRAGSRAKRMTGQRDEGEITKSVTQPMEPLNLGKKEKWVNPTFVSQVPLGTQNTTNVRLMFNPTFRLIK